MDYDTDKISEHWDDHTHRFDGRNSGLYWYEVAEVLRGINRRISGEPETDWVTHTLRQHLKDRLPVPRMLSLGCGTGHLERSLARLKAFSRCDGYDISQAAVDKARQSAGESGDDHIHYEVLDVNTLELGENSYDVAWCYGSLHHFVELEGVIRQLKHAIKPSGLFVFNEYVGPARFQFSDRHKEIANACLQLIPMRYRRILEEPSQPVLEVSRPSRTDSIRHRLGNLLGAETPGPEETAPGQSYRCEVGFPTAREVQDDDPSESVRSHEILGVLREHFELVEECQWGGNILQFLLSGIAGNFQDDDPHARSLIQLLWRIESTLLDCAELHSDFAYVVARPRKA